MENRHPQLGSGVLVCRKAVLGVLSVLRGFLDQCWGSTAEDAEDAEEERDRKRSTAYKRCRINPE